jgi:hypothetical protein
MSNSIVLRAAKVFAVIAGSFTSLCAALTLIFYSLATFVLNKDMPTEVWMNNLILGIAVSVILGFGFSIYAFWLGLKNISPKEPEPEAPISLKQVRQQLLLMTVLIVGTTGWAIYFAWQLVSETYVDDSTLWSNLIAEFLFLASTLYIGRHFLHELFEARDARINGETVKLSYLHLGERQCSISAKGLTKKKIT